MASKIKAIRKAASLIVLAKNTTYKYKCNFDILLQKRQKHASFANSIVFPGGVLEDTDSGDEWMDYFKSFEITRQDFKSFHHPNATLTPLFKDNPLEQHITLRIAAIRETFEEAGVLISRNKFIPGNILAEQPPSFDVSHWQKRVHNDSNQFLELCKELKCFPDIWSLHYWNNWLTPTFIQWRFDTAFFVVGFIQRPEVNAEQNEVANYDWMRPESVLKECLKGTLEIYPPQLYEMYRFIELSDFDKIISSANQNSKYGCPLYYPFWADAADGRVSFLPGDSLYPANIDETTSTFKDYKNYKIKDLRSRSNSLNRFEYSYDTQMRRIVIKNVKIPHHINISNVDDEVRFQL